MTTFQRFSYAFAGLSELFKAREFRLHVGITLAIVAAGVLACFTRMEWMLLTVAIGLVLVAEATNTAVEHLANAISRRAHAGIRRTKDVSAAAVLLAALVAGILGVMLFVPGFLEGRAGSCLL